MTRSAYTEDTRSCLGGEVRSANVGRGETSTRKGYSELWYEWVRFRDIRLRAPWCVSGDFTRGAGGGDL